MNTKPILLSLLGLAALGGSHAHAQLSAYTPEPGEFIATANYQYSEYNDFWLGTKRFALKTATGFEEQRQHSAFITLEYGILRDLAADVTLGYTWAEFTRGPQGVDDLTDDGLTDTTVGLRYRLVDERRITWAPTITLRAGGIIAGTYDEAFPFSAGDGASGLEVSALVAREICPGFGVYGDIGYRWRDNDVPDDLFGSAGVYASWRGVTGTVAYRHVEGQSGPDIGDPGFGVEFGFPEVKEVQQSVEASLGYVDDAGRYYQVYGGRVLEGRNTGERTYLGVSVSVPFGGRATRAEEPVRYYGKK
jgi:hypothetical protein